MKELETATNQKPRNNILTKVMTVFAALFGIFWIIMQLIGTIAYEWSIVAFHELSGIPIEEFAAEEYIKAPIAIVDEFFLGPFYVIFTITSTLTAIFGSIILTRKRSPLTIIGLMVGFFIPQEQRFWGQVKDSKTGDAIQSAIIRIVKTGKDKEEVVTETVVDLDGKYRIQLSEIDESLKLRIVASGYVSVLKSIDYVPSGKDTFDITQDIEMDRESKSTAGFSLLYLRPTLYKYLIWTIYIFSILLLVTYIVYTLSYPGTWYGVINIVIFVLSVIWNTVVIFRRYRGLNGVVLEYKTKKPLSGAFVMLFPEDDSKQLAVELSDSNGVVRFDLPAGKYKYKVTKTGYTDVYDRAQKGQKTINLNDNGFMDGNIFLNADNRLPQASAIKEANIDSPFN